MSCRTFRDITLDQPLVLITLNAIEGSSYQPLGAFKWVAPDRRSFGMISGGCLEEYFIDQALAEPLHAGRSWQQVVDSTLPEDRLLGSGLGCRGKLTVHYRVLMPGCLERAEIFAEQLRPKIKVHLVGAGRDIEPLLSLVAWRGWAAEVFTRTPAERDRLQDLSPQTSACRDLTQANLLASLADAPHPAILVLMTHHFPTDTAVLSWLATAAPRLDYLGILGSRQRRGFLLGDLDQIYGQKLPKHLLDVMHTPLGLEGFGKGEHAVALSLVSQLQMLFGFGPDEAPLR